MAVREALGWTSQALRLIVHARRRAAAPRRPEAQRQRYIPPVVRGDWMSRLCRDRAGAGSDAAAMETQAVRDGDYYVLNGTKHFITNGSRADYVIVFAVTDKEKRGHGGITAFIVEKGTPGFTYGKGYKSIGWRGMPHSELIFQDCAVPVDNLLGEEGEGFRILMRFLDERAAVGRGKLRGHRRAHARASRRLRQGAPDLRPPARRPPGDPVDAGRLGGRDSQRAADDLRRRSQDGPRRARHPGSRQPKLHATRDGRARRRPRDAGVRRASAR